MPRNCSLTTESRVFSREFLWVRALTVQFLASSLLASLKLMSSALLRTHCKIWFLRVNMSEGRG